LIFGFLGKVVQMLRLPSSVKVAAWAACATALVCQPAWAAGLSYISATGSNVGDCSSATAPCKTLSYAFGQTSAGGEIRALTPGSYGAVTLNKAITLTGVPGAAIVAGSTTLSVTAASTDSVSISGFTLNGLNTANIGIFVSGAGNLFIKNCVIKNFKRGIMIQPTSAVRYAIEDTLIAGSSVSGFLAGAATGTTSATDGALHRVSITGAASSVGLDLVSFASLRLSESLISNTAKGVYINAGNTIRLTKNTITQNATGVTLRPAANGKPAAVGETGKDNFIAGNTVDVDTTAGNVALTQVGTQ
jgi:nitrous oxidase accessory protein NosD